MSKIIKSFFSLLFLISFTASVSAADYNLRMTMNSNDQDEDYDGAVVFKNYVEAASNGKIAVELFVGTQLCSKGAECLQGVSDGSIDIYISTSGGAAGVFPYVQVLDLPYLMADDRIAEDVMQGDFVRTMRKMALKDSQFSSMGEKIIGPQILATANDNPGEFAKLVKKFIDDNQNIELKSLAYKGKELDLKEIKKLASLPTYEEAIARLM